MLCPPPKPETGYEAAGFSENNRNFMSLTRLVGDIGERVLHSLLPGSSMTGTDSSYDLQMPSVIQPSEKVLIEVKTAQDRNRGVIRTSQIERYRTSADATNIYYAQLFYRMKHGGIPSQFNNQAFEENFFPLCIYIFPISFIIYLVNTIHPTGQKKSTQFYGLTHHRARSLFGLMHDEGLFVEEMQERFRSEIFTTVQLKQNPEAKLHIVDHKNTPHILGKIIME